MVTHDSTYDFSTVVTADGNVAVSAVNTVELCNTGTADITIDTTYVLNPGACKAFGGRIDVHVSKTFAVAFGGTGTKKLNVIKETFTAKS